jgi:hypothetical protein
MKQVTLLSAGCHVTVSMMVRYISMALRYSKVVKKSGNVEVGLGLLSTFSMFVTERRVRDIHTIASYAGGPGSKPRPRDRLYSLKSSVVFSVTPGKYWDSTLKLGNDRYFPHPLKLTINLPSLHSTLYILESLSN